MFEVGLGDFGLAQQFDLFDRLDGWIRRRSRMCYWKPRVAETKVWRRPRTKVMNLVRLRVSLAIKHAISRKSYWRLSRTPAMRIAMPNKWLHEQGLLSLKQLWCDLATRLAKNTGGTAPKEKTQTNPHVRWCGESRQQ